MLLRILRLLSPALIVLAVWLIWPFFQSATTQVEKAQVELVELAGQRYWSEAGALLAADYKDQWEMSREDVIPLARELASGFLVLEIQWQQKEVVIQEDGLAEVTGTIHVEGNGAGASPFVVNTVNGLEKPWVFTWRKDGWKPGDWRLISVKQPDLLR